MGPGPGALTLRLHGTNSNRDAVGARVEVMAGGITHLREIYAGSSFLSMDSQWLTFGLGMVIWVINAALLWFGVKTFRREELLARL